MVDSQLGWSEAQWEKVNKAVAESFAKASVAGAFLPCYGPLAGSVETVRNETLELDNTTKPWKVSLSSEVEDTLKLTNLTVQVELSSEQVADESLSSALLAFRRAANILAQSEDEIVFQGVKPKTMRSVVANTPSKPPGLAEEGRGKGSFRHLNERTGQAVVSAVVQAVSSLEDQFHHGPFACVLSNGLFESVHKPSPSFVLPADRITPILKGPLLRSGQVPVDTGIVVSLAGSAIDIVVGTPPTVQFLQRTVEAKFLFRVYERFVLRVRDKEHPPVAGFTITAATAAALEAAATKAAKAKNNAATLGVTPQKAYSKAGPAKTKAVEEAEEDQKADALAGKVAADKAADAEDGLSNRDGQLEKPDADGG